MNPLDVSSFNHRTEKLSTGRVYHFIDQLPMDYKKGRTPTLLCVHGFPDCWYGWRYQIKPWVQRGIRVVVPDMLGYGGTDRPENPVEYTTKRLCADLSAILELLAIKKAVLIGHDWGAYTVSRFALWYPDRLLALVILSVPYSPSTLEYVPVKTIAKMAPNLSYQAYFEEQRSTKEIESNLNNFLRVIYRGPNPTQRLKLVVYHKYPQELDFYNRVFQQGMNGPLNYYRTAFHRHEEELAAKLSPNLPPDLPVLFIWGTRDTTTTSSLIHKAHKFIPRLQDLALEEKGHWILVEARDTITEKIAQWLEDLAMEARRGKAHL
ncbi:epoxide hydrolase [Lentinula aff. lateritia]|uniref:Epoxide hydrolase n=1 Tax=Lentinula aff. lateritia TaxID=2804960 RepID=A0ACC1TUA8_9AGAR|nr:epoxide hydrolase [Lentinula aff. lateritia]